MLRSMTGFGAGDCENDDYRVHAEVKAVNQRYLDIDIRMPRTLNVFEDAMKKLIKTRAARGKLDVYITFTDKREKQKKIRVDKNLAIAYHQALNDMSDLLHLARPDDVCEVAAYPDVLTLEEDTSVPDGSREVLLEALQQAMGQLIAMREAEGANILDDFEQRIQLLEGCVEQVAAMAPQIVENYRTRLQKTMEELLSKQDIDETRMIQEAALYADKVNYTEEVVRLRSHFRQFHEIVQTADAPVGRKLDFLVQEMNREINTVASKANCTEAAQAAVDIKSEIEKIREQIQNIE